MPAARTKRFLEMQGFTGLDDAALAQVGPWLRLAPAICAAWTAVATWQGSAMLLWSLVPLAALGAVLPNHPFDAFYIFGFRRVLGGKALPRYGAPRRFACGVATAWLSATAWAFQTGNVGLGKALGWSFVVAALVPATTDFCVPSFIYGLVFGKPANCRREA